MNPWLQGLRRRLLVTTILGLMVTSALFAMLAIGMGHQAEDRVLLARLNLAEEFHQNALALDQDTTASGDELIHITNDPHEFDLELATDLLDLDPGIHEWIGDANDGPQDKRERLIAVRDIPNSGRFWYIYDTTDLESNSTEDQRSIILILTTACFAIILSTLLALALGRWLFTPLRRLGTLASQRSIDDHLPLAEQFDRDEIGELATAFDEAHTRICNFLVREQAFTRDASHELRTPVTVLEGALDILDTAQAEISPAGQRALNRMRRACATMRMQIEAFLMLAREPNPYELEDVRVIDALNQALDRQRPLLDERHMAVRVASVVDSVIRAPHAVAAIVIDNLIRNAIQHSTQPTIHVSLVAGTFHIANATNTAAIPDNPLDPHVSGHGSTGLGLTIVDGLCRRCGWELDYMTKDDMFEIRVHFSDVLPTETAAAE